ncbi:amino acid adenylation domain-containing protein [Streptomyces cinnabarinus]|uniref:Amino acid adenylation domain-containing protein n=1 Tax=Streptomyces cinnabarinus TaxID=67287 RepID=A0ABY7KUN1_9ACTN|nr:amino acid adenylation domain-containing protein [Streptomyces cinnabarinus]WAZ26426.1 amino acid adenylation domain-containing protein [Streptomyces cinnabarinus]
MGNRQIERISLLQEQIWIAEQLAPGRSVYGIPMVIRLRGALDTELAARCVTEIVRRHEVLRSRVGEENGELHLITDPPQPFALPVFDFRSRPDEWRVFVETAARESFDLVHGPLLRAAVLRLEDDAYAFFLNMHHIVADGWSLRLFWTEFVALYAAWHAGGEPDLPDLTMQYRDFAAEQRRITEDGGYGNVLDAWARELAGATTVLALPVDHSSGASRDYQGDEFTTVVPEQLRADTYACAKRLGVTPFAMLGGVWGVLLARCTRQDDLLIGTPLAGRTRPEYQSLIGLFANTMPLRLRLDADVSFASLVRELQLSTFDALSSQDAPFTELVKRVDSQRTSRETPLFQTMFSFEQSTEFEATLPGCAVTELYEVSNGGARFRLSLSAVDALGELSLQFEYDSELFDPGTIEAMAESYLALLGEAVSHPEFPLEALRTSTDAAPDRELTGRPVPVDEPATLHALFERRVRQSPDAPAIEREDGTPVSYAQLNSQANRLARYLRQLGLRTGERVALALPHGSSWPSAVLAVLKAGGAYVPVAPDAPGSRKAHVLAETAPRLVLTVVDLAEGFAGAHHVLALDDPAVASSIEAQTGEDLEDIAVTGRQVAYVPFTSGSTGVPKGTLVTHVNLTAFTRAAVDTIDLGPEDRMLQLAAMTFDVHVEEFFPTWLAGGCVVFFDGVLGRTSPEALLHLLGEREITICELPTAYWIEVVRLIDPAVVPIPQSLRRVLVGGERAPIEVYQRWLDFGIPLTNVYGLTETAVTSTTYQPDADFDREALPIGRPMPHAAVYVLDALLAPVGRGVPGEIYLAGPGVSDGFLNRPEQTAERFLADPFAAEPGARMYRTGDQGRWTTEGDLEFLGRVDRQLKLRGHRVELAEIESVLDGHPDVALSLVVPRRTEADPAAELELIAFLIGAYADEATVAAYVRTQLPPHLVPAQISVVERFPLTSHGKIDEAALLALQSRERVVPEEVQGSELEVKVAEVYREVLKVPTIDLRTDIFALGFHSLAALRLVSRLNSVFTVQVPIVEFFVDSSVTNAARLIVAAGADQPVG